MLKKPTLNVFILLLYLPLNAQIITTPSSTDTLYLGDTCIIKWKNFDRSHKHVKIELCREDQVVEKIVGSKRSLKVYRWLIPNKFKPDLSYRVKLSSVKDEKYHCFSGNFVIKKPSIIINEPNSESQWRVGGNNSIKWTLEGGKKKHLIIQLFRNDKLKYTIASYTQNDGYYTASLPETLKAGSAMPDYIIKITGKNDSSICSISQPFSIINQKYLFQSLIDIPLAWMPDEDLMHKFTMIKLSDIKHLVFNVKQFSDEREDTLHIGENVERSKKRMVTVDESVSRWCRNHLLLVLKRNGLKIGATDYNIAIKGIVKKFFVLEGGSYIANAAIHFQALSRDGDILWEGTKTGTENNWGTSYKAINYYECISDAYLEAIIELFSDNSFRSAIAQEIIKLE